MFNQDAEINLVTHNMASNNNAAINNNCDDNQLDLKKLHYRIRNSKKAKRMFLHVSPKKGLEVVIPDRVRSHSSYVIENLLKIHQSWIERTLQKYQIEPYKSHINTENTSLPTEYKLSAIQKIIKIYYQNENRNFIKCDIVEQGTQVGDPYRYEHWFLKGPIHNKVLCQKKLHFLLKQEAAKSLIPWLQKLSFSCSLPYKSAKIRIQSSLWGSCTKLQKISLNAKLLFVEARLVQYVLIHELSHTKYLNHSKRFWTLVGKFDPDYRLHRRLLSAAARVVV